MTDGGMETEFIYKKGIDLPHFAALTLLKNEDTRQMVEDYFTQYFDIAKLYNSGFILGGFTWRANTDWGHKLGYESAEEIDGLVKDIIDFLDELRTKYETDEFPIILSGSLGSRGDGYNPDKPMSVEEAQAYHSIQIKSFKESNVDIISALTMNNSLETIGIVKAAKSENMPIAVSFTLETDGKLPTGQELKSAIDDVENATDEYPEYYMINCAHPTHFQHLMKSGEQWLHKIRGIRANASQCSHAELDNATELDDGNPVEFGNEYADILKNNPQIKIIGGCCGTDHRHVKAAIEASSELI